MTPYNRHDLIWLTDEGKRFAADNMQCVPPSGAQAIRELILSQSGIPAVVRRQEPVSPGLLCAGFSSPVVTDGIRHRAAVTVPLDSILKRITPFEIAASERIALLENELLRAIIAAGRLYGVEVGFFGSLALQVVTGLQYRHIGSDLDVYLRHSGPHKNLDNFFNRLTVLEKQYKIPIDAEIEYPPYAVKLKELYAPGKTVLGKGLHDVRILEKNMLMNMRNKYI